MRTLIFLGAVLLSFSANALDLPCGWDLEARIAAFHPTSSRFKNIYNNWMKEYQIEVNKPLWDKLSGWVNVGYMRKNGHSNFGNRSKLRFVPVSFGAKWTFCLHERIDAYVGVGACVTCVHIHDYSRFVKRHIHKTPWGTMLKSGIHLKINCNYYVDLFADYLFSKMSGPHSRHRVQRHHAEIGGWKIGGGLGVKF